MRRFFAVVAVVVVVLVGGALVALLAVQRFSPRQTPTGQPPLVELDATRLEAIRAEFNNAADRTRVLALLSPT